MHIDRHTFICLSRMIYIITDNDAMFTYDFREKRVLLLLLLLKTLLFNYFRYYKYNHRRLSRVSGGLTHPTCGLSRFFNDVLCSSCRNTIIMDWTENPGNPTSCQDVQMYMCVPDGGCPAGFNSLAVPSSPGPGWRVVGQFRRRGPGIGLALSANVGGFRPTSHHALVYIGIDTNMMRHILRMYLPWLLVDYRLCGCEIY
jgi:hypothetical protein